MICGFINKDYMVEYRDLTEKEAEKICIGDEFFSINMNSEYITFIDKAIYNEDNMDKIMPLIAKINKELFLRNKGGK